MTTNHKIQIDARDRSLGRVASEAAKILRGKHEPNFQPHLLPKSKVAIINASKLKMTAAKLNTKTYKRYSGYPGGLKEISLDQIIAKKGYSEPLRLAIKGMLPNNKLRSKIMLNLSINE